MAGQSFSAMKSIEDQFRNNSGRLLKAIQTIIPDCLGIHWTHLDNDRLGVDCLLELAGAGVLKIDFKFRRYQAIEEWIILETWSDIKQGKAGWAIDNRKKNDFFVFVRFHNNGFITEIMAVRRKAINELLLARYDDCATVGKVRNANSYQNGNAWQGEFVAFTPQQLASLLHANDYLYAKNDSIDHRGGAL